MQLLACLSHSIRIAVNGDRFLDFSLLKLVTFVPLSRLILFDIPGIGTDLRDEEDREVDTNGLDPAHHKRNL